MPPDVSPRQSSGGRPRSDPADVRSATIGVRVSAREHATLRAKAAQMHMTPAQWLREAALARRLPSPPVAAINREQYAELARLAANLNQLTRLANEGAHVKVADGLLMRMAMELMLSHFRKVGSISFLRGERFCSISYFAEAKRAANPHG